MEMKMGMESNDEVEDSQSNFSGWSRREGSGEGHVFTARIFASIRNNPRAKINKQRRENNSEKELWRNTLKRIECKRKFPKQKFAQIVPLNTSRFMTLMHQRG